MDNLKGTITEMELTYIGDTLNEVNEQMYHDEKVLYEDKEKCWSRICSSICTDNAGKYIMSSTFKRMDI